MSFFKGDYLRILTPRTSDGTTLEYDDAGKVRYKESHAPLTARKQFEQENLGRVRHLQHIIELVSDRPETFDVQEVPAASTGKVTKGKAVQS